jgi:hypothetical protein
MNGPFKMKPGRGNMPKIGRGLPKDMTNPIMQTTDPRSGFVAPDIDPKSGFESYQKKKVGRDEGFQVLTFLQKELLVHLKPNYQQLVKLKLTMEIRFQIPLKSTIMDKLKVLRAVVELNKH